MIKEAIEVIEIENGFAIKFPYELKDNFRDIFKSAKWNTNKKQWETGVRSEKRLKEWASCVNEAAQALIIAKTEEKTGDLELEELEKIRSSVKNLEYELITINKKTKRTKEQTEELASIRLQLEQIKDEVKKANIELISETQKKSTKLAEIEETVEKVCNMNKVRESHAIMCRNHNKREKGDRARQPFNDASVEINEENKKLEKIGFRSVGMRKLYEMNFNRPDRDNPTEITEEEYFKLEKI